MEGGVVYHNQGRDVESWGVKSVQGRTGEDADLSLPHSSGLEERLPVVTLFVTLTVSKND